MQQASGGCFGFLRSTLTFRIEGDGVTQMLDALSCMSSKEVTQVLRTCPQLVTTSENERVEAQPTKEPGGSPGKTTEDPQPPNPQRPTSSEPYKEVGTESLPAMTKQEIRVGQKEDPVIGPVLHFKSLNHKPNRSKRLRGGGQVCLLLKEWWRVR